jgi:hypothetical protein
MLFQTVGNVSFRTLKVFALTLNFVEGDESAKQPPWCRVAVRRHSEKKSLADSQSLDNGQTPVIQSN